MKPLIAFLAVIAVLAHILLSSRRHAEANEVILAGALQSEMSGVSVKYQYLDGFLQGTVPDVTTRESLEQKANELKLAGRIFNDLKIGESSEAARKEWPELFAQFADGSFLLEGVVPSLEISSRIQNAVSRLRLGAVENRLRVDPALSTPGWVNDFDDFIVSFFSGAQSGRIEADAESIRLQRFPFSGSTRSNLITKARSFGLPVVAGEEEAPPADFTFGMNRDGDNLNLSGWLPDETTRTRIVDATKTKFPGLAILDRIKISPKIKMPDWGFRLPEFIEHMDRSFSGDLNFSSRGIAIKGVTDAARRKLQDLGNNFFTGNLPVPSPEIPEFGLSLNRSGRDFTLDGCLPRMVMKTKILDGLKQRFPGARIRDAIRIDPNISMPEWGNFVPDFVTSVRNWEGVDKFYFDDKGIDLEQVSNNTQPEFVGLIHSKFGEDFSIRGMNSSLFNRPKETAEVLAVLKNKTLTLTGKVQSEDMKRTIERSARTALPGVKINNQLNVDISLYVEQWSDGFPSLLGDFLNANTTSAEFEINKDRMRLRQQLPTASLKQTYLSMARALFPDGELIDELSVKPKPKPKPKPTRSAKLKAFLSSLRVQFDGELPDQESRDHVVRGATKSFPKAEVQDNIKVTPEVYPAPWFRGFGDFLGEFSTMAREGEITIGDDEVELTGTASGDINHNRLLARLSKVMPKDIQIQDQMKQGSPDPGTVPVGDLPSFVVYYDTGSSQINAPGRAQVRDAVLAAKNSGIQPTILVKGFADSRGNAEANKRLSEKRAQGVVDSLIGQGIQREVIRYIGVGESESKGGDSQNDRRVEIILVP